MVSERKIEMVEELTDDLKDAGDVVFTDFQGLTVDEFEDLRQDLYENASRMRVVNNRLAERAFRRAFDGSDEPDEESVDSDEPDAGESTEDDLELTEISGLGPSKVEALEEEGFDTVESLSEADIDDLTSVSGVGEATAEKFVEGARDLLESEGSDSDSESRSSESSDESSGMDVDSLLGDVEEILKGNTALALSHNGYVNVAETIVEFAEEHENLRVKGGLLDGDFLEPDEVESVSELPSRREFGDGRGSVGQRGVLFRSIDVDLIRCS